MNYILQLCLYKKLVREKLSELSIYEIYFVTEKLLILIINIPNHLSFFCIL